MKFLIRVILTGIMIYCSWLETQAPWTTSIFILIMLSLEALNWMLVFISRQAKEALKQMHIIEELLKK